MVQNFVNFKTIFFRTIFLGRFLLSITAHGAYIMYILNQSQHSKHSCCIDQCDHVIDHVKSFIWTRTHFKLYYSVETIY